ncbi:hypothetical protein I316_00492 [Kwoniella heveanensis BCC8398]|uniref:Uncharacterized protein n=1 Tax=Kwoniella heveanensis BCC8398 TaxID=1296120 RepID=A0A1B9H275_9TREE|nr:hypothetical protein I316_00492 [Kwoniella heveanensis BCC8398]
MTNATTATTATSNAQTQQLPLDSPIPGRSWFNVNGGRFSQPSLVGYKEMDKALSKAGEGSDKGFSGLTKRFFAFERISARPPLSSSGSASASSESEQPVRRSILDQIVAPYLPLTYPSSAVARSDDALSSASVWRDRPMPKQHVDLSWKGVGMIVDFGWKRSEDGIKYEIEEALGREWVRSPVSSEAEVDTERAARGGQAGKDDEEEQQESATRDSVPDAEEEALPSAGNAKSGFWGRIPLVGGSW